MPRPKKSKIEDLARIRNNQRKCRERRRDYIAELEQKLKYHEDESVKRNTELHCENEVLRKSLGISGTSGEYPYWFNELHSTQTSGSWCGNIRSDDLKLEILGKDTLPTSAASALLQPNGTSLDQLNDRDEIVSGATPSTNDARINTPMSFPIIPSWIPLDTTPGIRIPTDPTSLVLWPVLTDEMAREDKTMLCSVAYRLILQSNKRQYDDSEIDNMIRCGFRLGRTQSEGCRVDNEVLLAVLSEISC